MLRGWHELRHTSCPTFCQHQEGLLGQGLACNILLDNHDYVIWVWSSSDATSLDVILHVHGEVCEANLHETKPLINGANQARLGVAYTESNGLRRSHHANPQRSALFEVPRNDRASCEPRPALLCSQLSPSQ